jgi:acyl-CoA thioester hydrolase
MSMEKSRFHFFFSLRVRYSEVDSQGVVFNANHVVYYQTVLTEYVRTLGYDFAKESPGTDMHTVRVLAEFKGPITFDQEIDIYVRAARIGRSSIAYETMICPKGGEQVLGTGEITWVNVDRVTGKSAPLSEELTGRLRALEGASLEA